MPVPIAGDLTELGIGLAIAVHRHPGPGLLESVYEHWLCHELRGAGIPFARLTYLRMSGLRIGLILNRNARRLAEGIRRYVMPPPADPPLRLPWPSALPPC